jgi:esterase/lipase superfamily enzyme
MMATPLLYRDTKTPLFGALAPELQGNRIPILYATDRKPATEDTRGSRFYGSERSTSGVLGVADVQVGRSAASWEATAGRTGAGAQSANQLSPSASEVVSVKELVRFPATPYLFRVGERGRIAQDPDVAVELEQAAAAARREIGRRLALTPRKEVFVFVHGVATQFDDALIFAAEFWHFLGREGVPIAYTWPAGAKGLFFYGADRESGEFTILHLKQFLRVLADIPEVEKVHIAAHSRGTDVTTTALRELVIESRAAGVDPRARYRIENLLLISADLDLEVAMQRFAGEALGPAVGRITISTNANDKALAAAKAVLNSRQRVGDFKPKALTPKQREYIERAANLDIIVYEGSGGGPFRHGYYTDPAVSSDILMLLRYGWQPGEGERQGLERISPNIWRLTATAFSD